jgi:hypothetical protein
MARWRQSEMALPSAADQAGGYVQHADPQRLRLNLREIAVEGEQPEPGDEVCGDSDDLDPGLVDGVLARREPVQPGVFGGLDAVLDAGVGTVSSLEERELPGASIGGEGLVAEAVGCFEQAELSARGGGVPGGR